MISHGVKEQWKRVRAFIHWMVHTRKKKRATPAATVAPAQTTMDDRQTRSIMAISLLILLGIAIVITFAIKGCANNVAGIGQSGWLTLITVVAAIALCAAAIHASIPKATEESRGDGSQPSPSPKKTWYWILGILALCIVVYGVSQLHWGHKSLVYTTGPANKQLAEQWMFEWELPPNIYVRGKNQGGPTKAEIVMRDDQNLWIDLSYVEYGKAEKSRLRLIKVGNKSWEGPWEQNNPKDFGRCDLHEMSPGNLYGTLTGTAGVPASCTLKRK